MMKKPTQMRFFKKDLRFFGGALLYGKRKSHRPLNFKEAFHLVIRSSWAKGAHSFLQPSNKNEIHRLILVLSKKYGIRIYEKAVAGNHLHFVMKVKNRRLYHAFIRALSGKIASHVMKQQSFKAFKRLCLNEEAGDGSQAEPRRTEGQGLGQGFWQFRPFTRMLCWGKDFQGTCQYVMQNTLEALGFVKYRPRSQDKYAQWRVKTSFS